MAVGLEKQTKRWTYEEYCKLDDDQRHEMIDGILLMAPAPDTWHQNWTFELAAILREHVRKNRLGRAFIAPLDVVLDPENTVQPDIVFVASVNLPIVQRPAIFGVPDLVVEVGNDLELPAQMHQERPIGIRRLGATQPVSGGAGPRLRPSAHVLLP
jgi:Uma2 family endonuclease